MGYHNHPSSFSTKKILARDLFDGRLKALRIRAEKASGYEPDERTAILNLDDVRGHDLTMVWWDDAGHVTSFYSGDRILDLIAGACGTRILPHDRTIRYVPRGRLRLADLIDRRLESHNVFVLELVTLRCGRQAARLGNQTIAWFYADHGGYVIAAESTQDANSNEWPYMEIFGPIENVHGVSFASDESDEAIEEIERVFGHGFEPESGEAEALGYSTPWHETAEEAGEAAEIHATARSASSLLEEMQLDDWVLDSQEIRFLEGPSMTRV